jgi:hypothetical protein
MQHRTAQNFILLAEVKTRYTLRHLAVEISAAIVKPESVTKMELCLDATLCTEHIIGYNFNFNQQRYLIFHL